VLIAFHQTSWAILIIVVGGSVLLSTLLSDVRLTVICAESGFQVQKRNRLFKHRDATYPWSAITETAYWETIRGGALGMTEVVMPHFGVSTAQGQGLEIRYWMNTFDDCVKVFNAMTPHLSYLWLKQHGYGRNRYHRVERTSTVIDNLPLQSA
jgi:hypothetical protein